VKENKDLPPSELALRVELLRQSRGMSRTDFAKLLGLSRPTVYLIETGERRMFADEILILSKEFNVSLDCLFGERSSRRQKSEPVAAGGAEPEPPQVAGCGAIKQGPPKVSRSRSRKSTHQGVGVPLGVRAFSG
jgi:transcriptional regulator with XRE-family HTH domain